MANAARAYRMPDRRRDRRLDIRVHKTSRHEQGLNAKTVSIARIAVAIVMVFALVGCVRISLTAATVNKAIATEALTTEVGNLQSAGANLEVQESSLSTPSYIRSYAANQLGMSAPLSVDTIALGGDVVACDAAGNLSLSLSLAQVAQG